MFSFINIKICHVKRNYEKIIRYDGAKLRDSVVFLIINFNFQSEIK